MEFLDLKTAMLILGLIPFAFIAGWFWLIHFGPLKV